MRAFDNLQLTAIHVKKKRIKHDSVLLFKPTA